MDALLQEAVLFLSLCRRRADDGVQARHDLQLIRAAAIFGHSALQVAVEFLRARQVGLRREDDFRHGGREFLADLR